MLVFTSACCLLLAWWALSDGDVRFAWIFFRQWRPAIANLRVKSKEDFFGLLGRKTDPRLEDWYDLPDFSKSDLVPVPLNGLAGEPTAEFRIAELGKLVDVDFQNKPLDEAVRALREQCDIDVQLKVGALAKAGVGEKTKITFRATGIPLRDALHSMLGPHGLTFVVQESVHVTSTADAEGASMPGLLYDHDWFNDTGYQLKHRLRLRGRLAIMTAFSEATLPDSRAAGYAVPKGARVLFLTDRMANAMDIAYTLVVAFVAVLVIIRLERRKGRRPPAASPAAGGGK
jgi:hypothetical protein